MRPNYSNRSSERGSFDAWRAKNTAKGGISDQPQLVDGISSINGRVDLEVRSGLHRIEIWVLIWNLTHHSCNLFCASEMEQFEFCKWYRNWKTSLLEIAFLLDQALRVFNFSHLHSTLFFPKKTGLCLRMYRHFLWLASEWISPTQEVLNTTCLTQHGWW